MENRKENFEATKTKTKTHSTPTLMITTTAAAAAAATQPAFALKKLFRPRVFEPFLQSHNIFLLVHINHG